MMTDLGGVKKLGKSGQADRFGEGGGHPPTAWPKLFVKILGLFSHWIWFLDTQNRFYFIVKRLKNAFLMSTQEVSLTAFFQFFFEPFPKEEEKGGSTESPNLYYIDSWLSNPWLGENEKKTSQWFALNLFSFLPGHIVFHHLLHIGKLLCMDHSGHHPSQGHKKKFHPEICSIDNSLLLRATH